MKNLVLLLLIVSIVSCKSKEDSSDSEQAKQKTETSFDETATKISGQEVFEAGNCSSCHQPDQKVIGPSLQEIAKTYKEKDGDLVLFLKEESDPIVDPGQYEAMKINLAITKNMSDEELKALEDYIYSFSK